MNQETKKAFIGHFYDNYKDALEFYQSKIREKKDYTIIEVPKGYLVILKPQK